MGKTIINVIRVTILKNNINDELEPKLVLTIIYIKNC